MVSKVVERGNRLLQLGAGNHQELVNPEGGTGVEEITYDYRIFLPRCEMYAFRLAGPEVTGAYGPLEYDEGLLNALPNYPYEEQLDNVVWVNFDLNEFIPCDGACECEDFGLWT